METLYTGKAYKLRAGSPMPVRPTGGSDLSKFVLHTFMAEETTIDFYSCTQELPRSREFRGQGGINLSANFSRLNVKGGAYFSGKITHSMVYIEEDDINISPFTGSFNG